MKIKHLFRGIFRDGINSIVIIISLAVGMASVNLILLFVTRELNTDKFQKNGDRIYMLKCDNPFEEGTRMSACRKGAAEYMKANFTQVEDYCRIKYAGIQKVIVNGETFQEKPVVYNASANFFNFFSFDLITNNPGSVLESETNIAISEELAIKYFGEATPVGQIITLSSGTKSNDFVVTGVFRKPASGKLLQFDMVRYAEANERFAFVMLKDKADPADLDALFEREKENIPSINDGTPGRYYLQSLKEAYFDTSEGLPLGETRDKSDLWIALVIGLVIILVASFNYLGLVKNKLLNKTREHSIRLINGGSKTSLVTSFMLENLALILISFALGLVIMSWFIPLFDLLAGTDIKIADFFMKDGVIIMSGVILFLLFITIAFSFREINNQTGSSNLKISINKKGKISQIPAFNITQVAASLILLVSSFVIIKQMNFITRKDIGLDKNVIEVKIPYQYEGLANLFKEEVSKDPSVSMISVVPASPLLEYMMALFHYTEDGVDKQYTPAVFSGDENFISTMGIQLLEGRNFSVHMATDRKNVIINESLARKFAGKNLLGENLPGDEERIVIGIVRDFNYTGLKDKIEPGFIIFNNTGNHLLIKPRDGMVVAAKERINETWTKLIPDYPVNIESVRERYEWFHRENTNYANFIGSCCIISLFLSMIGLFAISLNMSKKRIKEIGIRKINGATILEVIFLLNTEFLKWVFVSFLVAVPVSGFLMHKWLENFAYKTVISWWIFAIAGIIALAITLLTVSWQSWHAAIQDPVDSLRYE